MRYWLLLCLGAAVLVSLWVGGSLLFLSTLGDDAKRCNTRRKSEQSRVSECTWRVRLVVLGVPYWLLLLTGGALLGGSTGVTLPRRDRSFASFSLLVGLVSWIAVCDLKK